MKLIQDYKNGALSESQIMSQLVQNNPQLQTLLAMRGNMSYKNLFYNLAQQKGVNPDDILKLLS